MTGIQKVLFLAAQSKQVQPASELHAIEKSVLGKKLEILNSPIGSVDDITEGIQTKGAQIVHFCGDGKSSGNLIIELEGEDKGRDVKPQEIAGAFEGVKDISCVVLNYCYSAEAAKLVSQHIDYVTGINDRIDREAAIAFSKSFYGALKDDKTLDFDGFQKAVVAGKNALSIQGAQENILVYYTPRAAEVQLIEPANNSTVPMNTTFKGTYNKNLPTDSTMWVYVLPLEDDKYYLTRIDDYKDGAWKREDVVLGREGEIDRGKKFQVGVLIADKEVTSSTKDLNNEHARLSELPSGVQKGNKYEIVRE
ncbi:MAG: hypothetical protein PUP91_25000 [Rhizonema sp. PD37]|nr:hypothetical protein [Rhizonema sp. PD37]